MVPIALLHYLQLYNGSPAAGAVRTLYTVPAGYRVVVRNIISTNRGVSSATHTISVNSARVVAWVSLDAAGSPGAAKQWDGRLILNPGDELSYYIGSSGSGDCMVTGSIYSI